MRIAARRALALLALPGLTGLAACTAVSSGRPQTVLVTVTPTVTVTPGVPAPSPSTTTGTASPSDSATTSAAPVHSDVVGANHDLGRITAIRDEGGTTVVTLDRVQKHDIKAAVTARDGVPLEPHTGQVFVDVSRKTYSIPVRPDARLTKQTCVSVGSPAQQSTATLEELQQLTGEAAVVLVDLDAEGYATAMTSDPACS